MRYKICKSKSCGTNPCYRKYITKEKYIEYTGKLKEYIHSLGPTEWTEMCESDWKRISKADFMLEML
jgi:hypothetical protein